MTEQIDDNRRPRVGMAVHFCPTRHSCCAAVITSAVNPEHYSADSTDDEYVFERQEVLDYEPVGLNYQQNGNSATYAAADVAHSAEKIFPLTWHYIDECPKGR